MARDESSWLDSAFDDEAPDARVAAPRAAEGGYDWIDDAFDERKPDPLADKGMTGCLRLAVLACALAVIVILAFVAFVGFDWYALAAAPR